MVVSEAAVADVLQASAASAAAAPLRYDRHGSGSEARTSGAITSGGT